MHFFIDNQTLTDLELFPTRSKSNSIFGCYNCTSTDGGTEALYKYFKNPVNDIAYLEQRKQQIHFFFTLNKKLQLNRRQFGYIEYYLRNRRFPLRNNFIDAAKDGILNKLIPDGDYYIITHGIYNLLLLFSALKTFLIDIEDVVVQESVTKLIEPVDSFLNQKIFRRFIEAPPKKMEELNFLEISRMDYLFRVRQKREVRGFLDGLYELDVLQSMSQLMEEKSYSLTNYVRSEDSVFEVVDCFHPFIDDAVVNSYSFRSQVNLCFLTGPNMSGKSTFLKTTGLLVYLSHVGLPVPAKRFKTSLQNGLFTTINLTDNINLGMSHFYSEVRRVKEMALNLQSHTNMVVIFDELFRGTNVKDAFEATLLIIKSLAQIKNSLFFVSSHILEVAEALIESHAIDFRCFESSLNSHLPQYDYKLKLGLSKERTGLQILKNEKVKDILEKIIEKQNKNLMEN